MMNKKPRDNCKPPNHQLLNFLPTSAKNSEMKINKQGKIEEKVEPPIVQNSKAGDPRNHQQPRGRNKKRSGANDKRLGWSGGKKN